MNNSTIIHFGDGDVTVIEHYRNAWSAHVTQDYDYSSPVGYGNTMMEAIADLHQKLENA